MTMTDTRPAAGTGTGSAAGSPGAPLASPRRAAWLTGCGHVTIGRLYIVSALLLAAVAGVVGVLIRLERLDAAAPDDIFGGLNAYFQMWTLQRVGFLLLVAMPLLVGIAMVVVPLQVAAGEIAFPRAALASFWTWLIGALIVVVSVFAGGGWGALDGVSGAERDAIALTLLGTVLVIAALLLAAITLATTVIAMRPAGMNLLRVPLFAWSMLVAASAWLLTLPVAVANIVLIYVDLRGRDPISFGITERDDIWRQIDWIVEQPAVYAMAIAVLGIVADVVPVAVRIRPARHGVSVCAIAVFGLLAIGGWSQDYFTAPADHRDELLYVAFGLAAVLPVLALLGSVADSLRRGRSSLGLAPPVMLVSAVVAGLLLLGATFAGLLRVIEPFELLERATISGIFNALTVAVLAAALAGLWYWAVLIVGRPLTEQAGRAIVAGLAVGGVLLALPDVVAGFFGVGDGPLSGEYNLVIVDIGAAVSLLGAVLLALSLLALLAVVVPALARSDPSAIAVQPDPWQGHTLEWASASQAAGADPALPPVPVTSERPLLDRRAAAEIETA